jgi:cytoskeleton protein RodZ
MKPKVLAAVAGGLAIALLMFAWPLKLGRFRSSVAPSAKHATENVSKPAPQPPVQPGQGTPKAESKNTTPEHVEVAQAKAQPAPPVADSTPHKTAGAPDKAAAAPAASVVQATGPSRKHLSLKLNAASWVGACVDGQKLLARSLSAGDSREIDFSDKVLLRVGNAGAVEVAIDGKSVGSLGRSGQLRLVELSSAGLQPVPMRDPADDCPKAAGN